MYAVCTALAFAVDPIAQERYTGGIGQLKEVVRGFAQFWFGTGQSREGVDQFRGRIDSAALFAVVAILVLSAATRAGALNETVGKEHAFDRIIELFNVLCIN